MPQNDLIKTARDLLVVHTGRPRQSNLRRATSTAYYAMFHVLAESCADLLAGPGKEESVAGAWNQVYRALHHGRVRERCSSGKIASFSSDIHHFARLLVTMQVRRHDADYNPWHSAIKSAVAADITAAEDAIARFLAAPARDRRAFAIWLLLDERRA